MNLQIAPSWMTNILSMRADQIIDSTMTPSWWKTIISMRENQIIN
jgi:hypothetical protein